MIEFLKMLLAFTAVSAVLVALSLWLLWWLGALGSFGLPREGATLRWKKRSTNLDFSGGGKVSVPVDELVKSERVQEHVAAVRSMLNDEKFR